MSDSATEQGKVPANGGGVRWTHWAVLALAGALVLGFYAWIAESATRELSPSEVEENYYNLLVRGFGHGHLNLERDAPPEAINNGEPQNVKWLADHGLSDERYYTQWLEGHGLSDLSYYRGKLYLYFGVTPALLLFWPYVALTGHYLSHKAAVTLFLSVGFLAGMGLLCAVWRRYFKETSVWTVAAGTLALGLANFTPTLLGRGDVYEVPISCGYALTLLAMAGVWGALQDGPRQWRWLAAASLAYGLAVGARPSLLFGAVILLVPVAKAWREKRRLWPLLLAAGGPVVLIGIGLMIYNALRFDNPLEFGQRHQLPLRPHEQFSLRYFWFNFRVIFLEPARWSGRLPFLRDAVLPAKPAGYAAADQSFGVLTSIPVVWLALAAPLAWRSGTEEARSKLRWFLGAAALFFGMCALPLCLHDSMWTRYEVEIASPMVLLAVIGLLGLERALAGQLVWQRAARGGWGLLLAFSVGFNLCLTFKAQADLDCGIGTALVQRGRVDEAIAQYRKALRISPDYMEAHSNLGLALALKGSLDEAAAQYRKALEIRPDYPQAEYNLGKVLLLKGDLDPAMACLDKLSAGSQDPLAKWYNFGNQFLQERDWQCATICYRQAIKINPRFADAYANLGVALSQKGEIKEAVDAWQEALEINPSQLQVLNNLAWLLAAAPDAPLRNGAKAVALAKQADRLSGGDNPAVLRTLAAAYAETGSYATASATARRALELAAGQKNDALAAELQKEISLYDTGKAVRDAPQQEDRPKTENRN